MGNVELGAIFVYGVMILLVCGVINANLPGKKKKAEEEKKEEEK